MPELDIPTLQLAKKLASGDNFSPAWIDYPAWAGCLPDTAALVEKAAKYKTWAVEIQSGTIPPPPWLVEEWPDYQDETLNTPPPPKPERPPHKFACTIQYAPTPRPDAIPRRWSRGREPTSEEILDLAIRLDDTKSIPRQWFTYPVWASYPHYRASTMECIAILKQRAEAILRGNAAPPPRWLLAREPWRWIRQPKFILKTRPAPASLDEAARHRLIRNAPLGIACALAVFRYSLGKTSPLAPTAWRALPTARAGPGDQSDISRDDHAALRSREILLWYTAGSVPGEAALLPHAAFAQCVRHAVDRAQLFVIQKAKAA